MKLRGVEFGHVFNASGARGFYGEGYWFHKYLSGLNYRGSTLVTKTTTLNPRPGNMPLDYKNQPVDWFPSCIVVKPLAGVVLNAVGLSGPGLETLSGVWKTSQPSPLVISVMGTAEESQTRVVEIESMNKFLQPLAEVHGTKLAVQLNISCPNVGLHCQWLVEEARQMLDSLARLGVPLMVKVSAAMQVRSVIDVVMHPACDALAVSNTIPWGQLPDRIDWQGLFNTYPVSPLAKYGGGGLSGKPLLPIVVDFIREIRARRLFKPIVGGGGILSQVDALSMLGAGAQAVELGSVSILRPWRVQGIIRRVNQYCVERGLA